MSFVVIVNVHKMIMTKMGDSGKSRFLGRVVDKDSPLLEAVGAIDELQAILELIGADEEIVGDMSRIMGELSCDLRFKIYDLRIKKMEKEIEEMEKKISVSNKFLKFSNKKAMNFNWARTVCRRVERRVVTLGKVKKIDKNNLIYFNRLSDYLFLKAVELNYNDSDAN